MICTGIQVDKFIKINTLIEKNKCGVISKADYLISWGDP